MDTTVWNVYFLYPLVNSALAWVILVKGAVFIRVLGKNGMRVLTRIMGLFIAAIGITFIRESLQQLLR